MIEVNPLFLLTPNMFVDLADPRARVQRALGVAVTARNWRSVGKILELARQRG